MLSAKCQGAEQLKLAARVTDMLRPSDELCDVSERAERRRTDGESETCVNSSWDDDINAFWDRDGFFKLGVNSGNKEEN